MDLNKIQTFHCVATSKSFTEAAKKLYRTQPAVSQQIALLEADLGFKLFFRRRGKIFLSPEGEILARVVGRNLDDIRATVLSLKESLDQVEGTISLAVLLDHSTPFNLAAVISEFAKSYPQVEFSVSFGTNDEIEQKLIEGKAGLGLTVLFKQRDLFHRRPVSRAEHCLVGSPATYRSRRKAGVAAWLEDGRLIDFSAEFLCLTPWVRKNAPEALGILKSRPPSIVVPNHLEARELVLRDWGIALLPVFLCADDIAQGKLRPMFPGTLDVAVEMDIAHLRGRTLRRCEALFMDFVAPAQIPP